MFIEFKYVFTLISIYISLISQVDNVIGTVCCIKSLIRLNPDSEEFFILVQGLCRFILDETIYKNPLKMNKIIIIDNFKELVGGYKLMI